MQCLIIPSELVKILFYICCNQYTENVVCLNFCSGSPWGSQWLTEEEWKNGETHTGENP